MHFARAQRSAWRSIPALLLASSSLTSAISLTVSDSGSIKSAAKTIAADLMMYYTGNQPGNVPGNLPPPYFWWEAGAMMGTMIDYWLLTGDTTYNSIVAQAMSFQVGDDKNYMPANQTSDMGNDDQGFWGMAAMTAAETGFQDPPADQPQWLALAQAVFNGQASRWDNATCQGGLRWQVFPFNTGFDYKNSISNGAFFNIASRLARYTGNQTYAQWAETSWDWMSSHGLLDGAFNVYDGSHDLSNNCQQKVPVRWSYNNGIFMHGAANMYDINKDPKWLQRVQGLVKSADTFFPNGGPMVEIQCEVSATCNADQLSFKAYLSRWMAQTAVLVPSVSSDIMNKISASATKAAAQCVGNKYGKNTICGGRWTQGWDGTDGIGQEMSALAVVQANLAPSAKKPLTANSGGTSKGDPSAGGDSQPPGLDFKPITGADKFGAAVATIGLSLIITSVCFFAAQGE